MYALVHLSCFRAFCATAFSFTFGFVFLLAADSVCIAFMPFKPALPLLLFMPLLLFISLELDNRTSLELVHSSSTAALHSSMLSRTTFFLMKSRASTCPTLRLLVDWSSGAERLCLLHPRHRCLKVALQRRLVELFHSSTSTRLSLQRRLVEPVT